MNDGNVEVMRENPFALAEKEVKRDGSTMDIATTRASQEVQAAMVVAKRFPRNEEEAFARIMRACSRKGLAEQAAYAYPRGGTTVTGPSIRLAEALAQNWGNIDFGIVELEQKNGESTVMAYAWDLQTNSRQTKIFQVPHSRKAGNQIKSLTDPRDIYEMVANQGARRLRACILGIIPGDIIEAASEECDKTLTSGTKEPLIDRVRRMAAAFGEYGVTVPMIEKRLQHRLDATIEAELVQLRKVFTSIKDGAGKREDYFDLNPTVKASDANQTPPTPAPPVEHQPENQPEPTPPAPVLGEKKPSAAPKKETPAKADISPRQAAYNRLKEKMERDGIKEGTVTEYLVTTGALPMGSSIAKCPSDLIQSFADGWETILEGIQLTKGE